ncbi:hypothetical protein ED28_13980 [[Pantoea] beijingensis]|uniref:Alpha/beta hydrolase fold-3 domain-containing protein n=1 Tax=[Pantoea] beijingensis TaxID=1324864 RepID=A0A443IAJ0_9GAMM|nr:alpha/beta hydrolase [[Pantoea] beijingensis]RWR01241.1 hypothetical protein ED28_13980 [[Pantoea] beijingensis]
MKFLSLKPQYLLLILLFSSTGGYAQSGVIVDNTGIDKITAEYQQVFAQGHHNKAGKIAFEKMMSKWELPEGVVVRDADAGGVAGKWISPAEPSFVKREVILYLHGGGFYRGSSKTHQALAATLARQANADVLLIDYRLLPQYGYPSQIDDARASYEWLLKQGYKASNIALAGDSVGGTLVLELALHLRDAGRPMPSALVVMSPVTDLTASSESMKTNATRDPILNRSELLRVAHAYLKGSDPRDPAASPLFADLHGLPPMLLQVGDGEILLDDTLRIAQAATRDDVQVSVEVWPGMIHQWQLFPAAIPNASRALTNSGQFIRDHVGKGR